MKIRKGFVSNSSSSSFFIALDKKPETSEEIRELFFGGLEYLSLEDNIEEGHTQIDRFTTEMLSVMIYDIIDSQNREKIEKMAYSKEFLNFIKENEDKFIFHIELEDCYKKHRVLEESGVLEKYVHFYISRH